MIRAGRSFEHPGRNLQAAIRVRSARRAAENDAIGLLDRFMNGHLKPKPRVPRIQKLPKRGPVGVLKPCSTITGGCIRRWDISARWRSRKSGLLTKNGSRHNCSAKGDAKCGQGHCRKSRDVKAFWVLHGRHVSATRDAPRSPIAKWAA